MILTDDEIKVDEDGYWIGDDFDTQILAESHLEANARIRELEAELGAANQVIDGLAKYVDRADRAEARVAELESINRGLLATLSGCCKCLRELADAAEWRDECQKRHTTANDRIKADERYQSALSAAKGE